MRHGLLVATLGLPAACSGEPEVRTTDGRATDALTLTIEVASNGEAMLLQARVLEGTWPLELSGDDRLVARVDGLEVPLVSSTFEHVAIVPSAARLGEIALVRASGEARATFTLPAVFGVVGPSDVKVRSPIALAFDPDPALATDLVLYGDCVRTLRRRSAAAIDQYRFDGADVFVTSAAGCIASVRATRGTTEGVAFEGLAAARGSLSQERTWSFRIVP